MLKKNLNGGFIGLIVLLIAIAFIALFMMRTDLFLGKDGAKNVLEQGQDAIQKAKDVKAKLEANSQATPN